MLGYKLRYSVKLRHKRLVLCLFNKIVKDKDHTGKDCYTSDYSEYNTLCHYYSKVKAESKAHKAKSYKACNCGY